MGEVEPVIHPPSIALSKGHVFKYDYTKAEEGEIIMKQFDDEQARCKHAVDQGPEHIDRITADWAKDTDWLMAQKGRK